MLSAAGLVSVWVALRLTATITAIRSPIFGNRARELVPRVGFEPTAYRLRSGCSTAELSGHTAPATGFYYRIVPPEPSRSGAFAALTSISGPSVSGSMIGNTEIAACAPGSEPLRCGTRQDKVSKPPQRGHSDRHSP